MKKSKRQKVVALLESKGWQLRPINGLRRRSRKYLDFEKADKDYFYFVGRHGALRRGRCVSKSISVSYLIHNL